MKQDLENGTPLTQVVRDAKTSNYVQPDWDVDNVVNANGNVYQIFIDNFGKKVAAELPDPPVPVPIVLVVMNEIEAGQLIDGTAFKDLPDVFKNDFAELIQDLTDGKIDNWIDRYGKASEDWRPFVDSAITIKVMLTDLLDQIKNELNYHVNLVPAFHDIRLLNDSRDDLMDLRENGCIILKDFVSIRHPKIQREYRRTLLDAFPKTRMVRIAPLADAFDIVPPMVTMMERYEDLEFYKRLIHSDPRCKESYKSYDFRGWFVREVPGIIPPDAKAKSRMASHVIGVRS